MFRVTNFRLRSLRAVGSVLLVLMVMLSAQPVSAQEPTEELIAKAATALKNLFSECSSTKFLECITLGEEGFSLGGFMNRTINGGTEATDIEVGGWLTATDAERAFQIDANSIKTVEPTLQFGYSETFDASPGQTGSGVLKVWYSDTDGPRGNGFGRVLCGRLNIGFRYFLTAPPGTINANAPQLVSATREQLRTMMSQIGTAFSQEGACAAELKTLVKLDPIASAAPYTLYEGDTVNITGVVWAMDEKGLQYGPVQTQVVISSGGLNVEQKIKTDAQGYFEYDYPFLDGRFDYILVTAVSPDPKRYKEGTRKIELEVKLRGALQVSIATDKATYKKGESVTLLGNVTQDGKPFPATVLLYSDALPLEEKNSGADGSYTGAFVPGTERDRNKIGLPLPGVHFALVKAIAPGYETGIGSVNYLLLSEIGNTEECAPLAIAVTRVTGVAHIVPLNEEELNRQGILKGFGKVNEKTLLAEGMTIQTSDSARVALHFIFGDGSDAVVVLNSSSTLKIGRFCQTADGKVHGILQVNDIGQVAVNVMNANVSQGPLDFKIVTPSVAVKSVQTRYFVNGNAQGGTTVAAIEGTVLVSDPNGANEVSLTQGNLIQVNAGAQPDASDVAPMEGALEPGLEELLARENIPPVTNNTSSANPIATAAPNAATVPVASSPAPSSSIDVSQFALPAMGVMLLLVLGGGAAFFVLARRRTTTASSVLTAQTSRVNTMPSGQKFSAPPDLPERATTTRTTQTERMTFERAESEYFKLRGQLATERITREQFESRLHDLMVQDEQGRYWMLGVDSGKWYRNNGSEWVEANPQK